MTNDPIQLAWAAGLFEGEGSFYINTIIKGSSKYQYLCAALRMTDKDIVERFAKIIDHYNPVRSQQSSNPRYKLIWEVRIGQTAKVKEMAEAFWPFLGSRRKEKYQAIVAQLAEASDSKTE